MFFSILIPVYNSIKYLPECLDSVIHQSYCDYEIVLIDDGSTDESGLLCDKYAERYPFVRVIHKQNEGLMMTRRRGFLEAKGDYFICIDSDDKLYDKKALELLHNRIVKTGCDLVLYDFVHGADEKNEEKTRTVLDFPDGYVFEKEQKVEIYDRLLTTNHINSNCIKCSSREILDLDIDYSVWKKDICRAEDFFQSFPIIDKAKRIAYVKQPLYYYRSSPNSISHNVRTKYYYALKCIFNRASEYMKKWEVSDDISLRESILRITMIMDVICNAYFTYVTKKAVHQWKDFCKTISKDEFFLGLINNRNKKSILKYYRLLHFLVRHRLVGSAAAVIRVTTIISGLKHRA